MKIQLLPRLFVLAAITFTFSVETACADDVIAKAYNIKDVSELVVSGGGRVQITQGDTESLRVEATRDVMERVKVDLSGDKLSLSVRNTSGGFSFFDLFKHRNDDVLYVLQLKKLHYLGLSGASRATFGNWVGGDMKVNVSGAGEAKFTHLRVNDLFVELTGASNSRVEILTARTLKFELSGAANMDVKGASQTNFLKIGASGASNFRGKLLKAAQADVDASGASNVDLQATEYLKAGASGASNIRYLGQPKLDSNASGASNIKAIND
ncbi:MAG TPA: DUF2807 domain-containing protein [Cellvibrio sp.]|nr:DUF2807 domain-containing protein [Cellvibrio sp.]